MSPRRRKLKKSKQRKASQKSNKVPPKKKQGDIYSEFGTFKEMLSELRANLTQSDERIQDLEIHVNLLTRLLTTLCVEKFGMRVGVLKRFMKRVEKEAIRDSQISHLEKLYKLSSHSMKKNRPPGSRSKTDPWDEIS